MDRPDYTLLSLTLGDEREIEEVASLLMRSFRIISPQWLPTIDHARAAIVEALEPGDRNRLARPPSNQPAARAAPSSNVPSMAIWPT